MQWFGNKIICIMLTAMAEPILITTCAPPSSLRGSSTMAPRVKKLVTKHNLARNVQSCSATQCNTWAASSTGKPHLLQSPATAIIGIPLQRLSCWPAAAAVWTETERKATERPRPKMSLTLQIRPKTKNSTSVKAEIKKVPKSFSFHMKR